MKLGIDIMGGDFAPDAALKGASEAAKVLPQDVTFVLIGKKEVIDPYLEKNHSGDKRFAPVYASEVIDMSDPPTKAIIRKPDSSIAIGFSLLKSKEIDAFMSAGSTGAMMVGALYSIKAIEGILRPSIASIVPKQSGNHGVLLDVGANADCKPEVLHQFAVLGALYSKYVFKIDQPKVALLSIGSEKEKGNLATQAAYQLIDQNENLNFIGNIEGYDFFTEKSDVMVCDGFTGNILLKFGESIFHMLHKRGIKDEYFDTFNYQNYGGTPVLGVNAPVIIGHGVSNEVAFKNMLIQGSELVKSGLIDQIKSAFELNKIG
jgi:phosphate acyltransferase